VGILGGDKAQQIHGGQRRWIGPVEKTAMGNRVDALVRIRTSTLMTAREEGYMFEARFGLT
jgi:hypothetical protein